MTFLLVVVENGKRDAVLGVVGVVEYRTWFGTNRGFDFSLGLKKKRGA